MILVVLLLLIAIYTHSGRIQKIQQEGTCPKEFHEIDAFQHYDQFKEEDVLKKTFVGYLHYCKASAGCPDISWLINNHEKKCGTRIAEFPQLQNLKDEIAVKIGRRRVKRIDYRSYPQGGTFAHAKARKVTAPSNQSQLIIGTVVRDNFE
ncbi:hypothetical protein ANCCAN_06728 [Ancylostoma caninum]|uniref:Uncharacterized protein n=1 Tax=Ancylostoma caninum TaxID=29170 RepID=A0A368GRZ8_ANCCA|nr:hypothetical protein ANCCAN_06728 [Ancylostoma caninum]